MRRKKSWRSIIKLHLTKKIYTSISNYVSIHVTNWVIIRYVIIIALLVARYFFFYHILNIIALLIARSFSHILNIVALLVARFFFSYFEYNRAFNRSLLLFLFLTTDLEIWLILQELFYLQNEVSKILCNALQEFIIFAVWKQNQININFQSIFEKYSLND